MQAIITVAGSTALNAAITNGQKLGISKICISVGSTAPSAQLTNIGEVGEELTDIAASISLKPDNLVVSGIVKRRRLAQTKTVGIYDESGALFAVSSIAFEASDENQIKEYIPISFVITDPRVLYIASPMRNGALQHSVSSVIKLLNDANTAVNASATLGQNGMLVKKNKTGGSTPSWLMRQAMVVENAAELNTAMNSRVSFSTIFNTWYRFSHRLTNHRVYPAAPEETTGWSLSGETLRTTVNADSYIGFISPDRLSEFTFDVTIASNDIDDDFGAVVVAFTIKDGVEHSLSLVRTPSATGWAAATAYGWALIYNFRQQDETVVANGGTKTPYGNGRFGATAAAAGITTTAYSWTSVGSTRVIVERNNDIIRARCSRWGSNTVEDASLIEINMANFPILAPLREAASYGYGSLSQPGMTYVTNLITNPNNMILNSSTGQIYKFSQQAWRTDPADTLENTFGVNNFIYSKQNNRTYFAKSPTSLVRVI